MYCFRGFIGKVLIALLFVAAIGIGFILLEEYYRSKSTDQVLVSSRQHTQYALSRLIEKADKELANLRLTAEQLSVEKTDAAFDSVMSSLPASVLSDFIGVEGGVYVLRSNSFVGYAFPTGKSSEQNQPDRSELGIIRNQILVSIDSQSSKIELFDSDSSSFLLATAPVSLSEKHIGGIYALFRLDGLPPFSVVKNYLHIEVILSVLGISIAIFVSIMLRRRVQEIVNGLETIKRNSGARLGKKKGILGVIASSINDLLDTREKDQIEKERLERELQAKDRLASLGNLVAGVTHQVKTPLAIIKAKIQMWQKKLSDTNVSKKNGDVISTASMKDVVEEIDKLTGLVNRLLLFLRNPVKEFSSHNLNELIRKTVHALVSHETEKNIKTVFALGEIPDVKIDSASIEQVFINIIVNALQAIPEEGMISVATSAERGNVIVTISDSGSGISPENAQHVFEPFFTTKSDGSGLGLSVAYEIINAHKGTIYIEPNPDSGATVTVTLPLS